MKIYYLANIIYEKKSILISKINFSHQKSSSESIPAEMIRILFLMFWSCFVLALICEFGEMVRNEFEIFDNEICQCNWYYFPIKIQRMFVIVIANTQQLEILQAFGNIPCTREIFKKVKHKFQIYRNNCLIAICIVLQHFTFHFRRLMQASPTSWRFVKLMDKNIWFGFVLYWLI